MSKKLVASVRKDETADLLPLAPQPSSDLDMTAHENFNLIATLRVPEDDHGLCVCSSVCVTEVEVRSKGSSFLVGHRREDTCVQAALLLSILLFLTTTVHYRGASSDIHRQNLCFNAHIASGSPFTLFFLSNRRKRLSARSLLTPTLWEDSTIPCVHFSTAAPRQSSVGRGTPPVVA